MTTLRLLLVLPLVAIAVAAHAGSAAGPKPPGEHHRSATWDLLDNSIVRPATRALDVPRAIRRLLHDPLEAGDVDARDEVRLPSTWWTPRLGYRPITPAQMLHGPGPGEGPAPGKWMVTSAKSQGVSPGFQIKDSRGGKFLVKLDPPQFPLAATGADVIGAYLFWAAGYNVPDNAIREFSRDDLVIAPHATYNDKHGRKRALTDRYLDELLAQTAPPEGGRYRCVTSRYLAGKPLGPFEFSGRRKDDPDDLVPHERRRELRGLWTISAWLNHCDSRSANSLDMWVTEDGRSFVRHYLIDFGSTLGSAAMPYKRSLAAGSEFYLDYGPMVRQLVTLGLYRPKWEHGVDPELPSIGYIEAQMFDPAIWRPDYPNPAFDERTDRDARWGARIVAAFTDDHIRAAVGAGHLDPEGEAYLVRTLIARRDKITQHWLGGTPGLPRGPDVRAGRTRR